MKKSFSKMDIEIITLICKEHTSKSIASIIGLSKRTIENHRQRIALVMDVESLAGLVVYAIKNKIVNIEEL